MLDSLSLSATVLTREQGGKMNLSLCRVPDDSEERVHFRKAQSVCEVTDPPKGDFSQQWKCKSHINVISYHPQKVPEPENGLQ